MCELYDEQLVEQMQRDWEISRKIDSFHFPRLLAIATRCQSVARIEDENEWLRGRLDALTSTTTT